MDGKGYGYSLWYVPNNYKELQVLYNMLHIPHVAVETNLQLKDAYQMYNYVSSTVKIKIHNMMTQVPSPYTKEQCDSFGWNVDIVDAVDAIDAINAVRDTTIDKHHIVVCFHDRNKRIEAMDIDPPNSELNCKLYIVDTQSNTPSDWTIHKKYLNIKASQSINLTLENVEKKPYKTVLSIDEYFGTTLQSLNKTKCEIREVLKTRGFQISEGDITLLMHNVKSELSNVD
jgi:hypothetical protein